MSITYRTKRRLQRAGLSGGIVLRVVILGAFCWVVWLERYVVYTRDNDAMLDLDFNANEIVGEVAMPPSSGGTGITIYYNEGDNAGEVSNALFKLDGYYAIDRLLFYGQATANNASKWS